MHRLTAALLASLIATLAASAHAEDAAPQAYDAKFQTTYIWQQHGSFPARYAGPNSLSAEREPRSYSWTATAYLGARAWHGAELYFNPELVSTLPLSSLHGLGSPSNGENQKGGGGTPKLYRARLFLRQTIGFGGDTEALESAPNQLAGSVDKHRLVLTLGNIALADIFDANTYSHDARTQFINWTIMANGAFDYAADTRGYTVGLALEYYRDDWAVRVGRFEQPSESNGSTLDKQILHHYGDQIEIEHEHNIGGQSGKLRLLAFHNQTRMGRFQDALDAWRASGSAGVPDVANVRREHSKCGWGLNLEQAITPDLGLFLRASWNDGKTETYAFTEAERSLSGGLALKGTPWHRADDTLGLAIVQNGLSAPHQAYLASGGLGAFIGDGAPPPGTAYHYGPERVIETYYSARLIKGLWLSLNYQYAQNPAYNTERGPVNFGAIRMHAEY